MKGDALPDSKVHGGNMGPIWGRQDPGGPHAGPMNFAIWAGINYDIISSNNNIDDDSANDTYFKYFEKKIMESFHLFIPWYNADEWQYW